MAEIAPLRPAATVVVLRPAAHPFDELRPAAHPFDELRPAAAHPFEVLLVRRSDQVAFMAGAHVFPGGRVDDTDIAQPAEACTGLETLGRFPDLSAADEAQSRVAALRELVEEAGVVLARRDGRMVDAATAAAVRASLPPRTSLVAHLASLGLTASLDAVMPFAHWVTPDVEIRRFDTRFLLARMPEQQTASPDHGEMTALEWLAPAAAVARAARRAINLPPPTWSTLARLARFASIDEAWQWASRTPIVRIQPGFLRDGDTTTLFLPGDARYPRPEGCEPFEHTRFEMVAGAWRPVGL